MLDSDQFDMPAAASVKQTIYHRIWNIILFVLKVSIFSFLEGSKEYFVHKSQHGILESTKKWIVCLSSGQVLCRWSQSSFVVLHYKVFNLDLRGQFFLLYLQPPSKTEKKKKQKTEKTEKSFFILSWCFVLLQQNLCHSDSYPSFLASCSWLLTLRTAWVWNSGLWMVRNRTAESRGDAAELITWLGKIQRKPSR